MYIMTIYFTTSILDYKTIIRKRKRVVSKKEQLSILEHEKFLKKMGVDPNYKKKAPPLKTERKSVKLPERKKLRTMIGEYKLKKMQRYIMVMS